MYVIRNFHLITLIALGGELNYEDPLLYFERRYEKSSVVSSCIRTDVEVLSTEWSR
jgi:hypothetical protein